MLAFVGRKMLLDIVRYNPIINLGMLPEGLIIIFYEKSEFIIPSQKVRQLAFK